MGLTAQVSGNVPTGGDPMGLLAKSGENNQTSVWRQNQVRNRQAGPGTTGSSGMESPVEYFARRRRLIGERLRSHLADNGISQGQLARMVRVDPAQVWDWVHGVHAPSDRYLRRMEDVLGVARGYFTCDQDEEAA